MGPAPGHGNVVGAASASGVSLGGEVGVCGEVLPCAVAETSATTQMLVVMDKCGPGDEHNTRPRGSAR